MKKTILLLSLCVSAIAANAQLTLSGGSYTQNFDGIGSGMPTGWQLYTGATSSSLGVADVTYGSGSVAFGSYFDTTDCPADVFGTGFKNSASANGGASLLASSTCATQEAQTDRALSVRQCSGTSTTHPGFDPGPAFALHLANTSGMRAFNCSFELQSLDQRSGRTTTWMVDYGFGATPTTFTPATAVGTMAIGGSTFTNNNITVNFGTALDNMASDVWIRIVTLSPTTGSGNRTTSGIDNFMLSWGPLTVQELSAQPATDLTVLGTATPDNINMKYNVEEAGNYSLTINDIIGRVLHTETVNATNGGQVIAINGLNLAPGMYIATMQNANSKAVARVSVQ